MKTVDKIEELRTGNVYLKKDTTGDQPEMEKYVRVDLNMLYDKAFAELGLQQSKRDQLIALYLTVISLMVTAVLPAVAFDAVTKGVILVAAAVVGFLLTLVIVRYRIYKEVYWLTCQTLTVMMNMDRLDLDETRIKMVFAQVMLTKARSFLKEERDGQLQIHRAKYIKKSFFSAETIYYIIQALCASVLFSLGVALISGLDTTWAIALGIVLTAFAMAILLRKYFLELIAVYEGLTDMKRFKQVFGKAWFLHMFLSNGQKNDPK